MTYGSVITEDSIRVLTYYCNVGRLIKEDIDYCTVLVHEGFYIEEA
jgi:hypothetical protein